MRKATVLLVEDDQSVAFMLEKALADEGFAVRLETDGLSGWHSFQADRPDIVVSDIRMPRMDGVELLAKIKTADPEMDVVLVTGYSDVPTAIRAVELGAYRYVEKPIHQITDLIQTLKRAMEKRQLVRDRRLIDRISRDLSRQLSLSEFSDLFLEHILAAFPQINIAIVYLYDPQKEGLVVLHARGNSHAEAMNGLGTDPAWSIGAQAFEQATLIRIDIGRLSSARREQIRRQNIAQPFVDLGRAHPTGGALAVPIVARESVIGSLGVFNSESLDELDDHLADLLTTLCRQVGLYLQNARLYENLLAQTDRLQAVIKSTADGIMVVDPAGNIIMTNPRYQSMLASGSEPSEKTERRLVITLRLSLEAQETASFVFPVEHSASDEPTILEVYASAIRQNGEPIGIAASLRDVTLHRRLDRKRNEILELAKHEVGTPLTAIKLYAQELLDLGTEMPEDQRAEILRQITRQAAEVDTLVNETLSYSQLKEALLTRERIRMDLSQLANELVKETAILAAQSDLQFRAHIEPGLWVVGNYSTLKQVFRNLLDNARKFTPAGGTISWRVCRDGPEIQVQVEDSGVGIPREELDKIFEPYYRSSSAGDTTGTGLGLSIVRDVVTAHRGRIAVDSTEGEGSRFTVTLLATAGD
jgi:PAS domain S-box-containing protein